MVKGLNDARGFVQELEPLQADYDGELFGEESLLMKALTRFLTEREDDGSGLLSDQETAKKRDLLLYRGKVETVVARWNRTLLLEGDQRQRLIALLLEEIRPPPKFSVDDTRLIQRQAAMIPETKYREILTDPQRWVLTRQFAQYLRFEGVKKPAPFPALNP